LYTELLKRKNSILSDVITDRGFKPKDLLSYFDGNNLIKKYNNGEYLFNDGYDFSRHLSFKIWLNEIKKFKN